MLILIVYYVLFMKIKELKEGKLGSRPSWDEYFLGIAIWTSTRASCKHVRVGSVFVQDSRIIGTGYNGAPPGLKNCLDVGCRKENLGFNYGESMNTGRCIGVHSEVNALGHLTGMMNEGSTLYITVFPCHTCAKDLLAYKIKRIVFKSLYDSDEFKRTLELFKEAKVKVEQLDISFKRYVDILINQPRVDFDVFRKEEIERAKEIFRSY